MPDGHALSHPPGDQTGKRWFLEPKLPSEALVLTRHSPRQFPLRPHSSSINARARANGVAEAGRGFHDTLCSPSDVVYRS